MKLTFFDIETYRTFFCFCAITYDSTTHEELGRALVMSDSNRNFGQSQIDRINKVFEDSDYIISYNGTRFDLPVLAKIKSDVKKLASTCTAYIHSDANALISYDDNRNPMTRNFYWVKSWSAKHFDLLNN